MDMSSVESFVLAHLYGVLHAQEASAPFRVPLADAEKKP